jgi:hypothetical protein
MLAGKPQPYGSESRRGKRVKKPIKRRKPTPAAAFGAKPDARSGGRPFRAEKIFRMGVYK